MTRYFMAIDQGTTSSRAMIFNDEGQALAKSQMEFTQYFPHDGWVEHDGMEILQTVLDTTRDAISQLPEGAVPSTIGITNQRETTVIWNRQTGQPIYPAIVWQDRRTDELCQSLKQAGHEDSITDKTGLLLDPYFSATKIKWILDHVAGARDRAKKGELAFGTVDSFILWHLTGGKVHATDVTNASRTMLYNIRDMAWDEALLALFEVPASLLPKVHPCDHHFGDVDANLFGQTIPITAIAGDQQAAMIGQGCFEAGQIKCTYGTGGFIMMNIGDQIIRSQNRLLTTVAYSIQGVPAYALEGSFFSAGSAVQWLRDGLKIIESAEETEALARSLDSNQGVYMVPAFTGLGAPHWNPNARGTLFGLTRATGVAEIARAALEAVGFQTSDLLDVMQKEADLPVQALKLDGGMTQNEWLMQFVADILQSEIVISGVSEITSYGIAMLAGNGSNYLDNFKRNQNNTQKLCIIEPKMSVSEVERQKGDWEKAIKSVCYNSEK